MQYPSGSSSYASMTPPPRNMISSVTYGVSRVLHHNPYMPPDQNPNTTPATESASFNQAVVSKFLLGTKVLAQALYSRLTFFIIETAGRHAKKDILTRQPGSRTFRRNQPTSFVKFIFGIIVFIKAPTTITKLFIKPDVDYQHHLH